jgi:hypothetical protein
MQMLEERHMPSLVEKGVVCWLYILLAYDFFYPKKKIFFPKMNFPNLIIFFSQNEFPKINSKFSPK